MARLTIMTGGQTGVDRGALDAAMDCGVPTGGWCPEGRLAEDGIIPLKYPVKELPGAGYAERTRQNVIDSDGTLVIYFEPLSGGTALTVACCKTEKKPYLLMNGAVVSHEDAAKVIGEFIHQNGIGTLNVAGPRASEAAEGHDTTFTIVQAILNRI